MESCPACEADLDLDEEQLQEGGVVNCSGCGAHLEVVNTHPLELNQLDDEDEDEDDDEDEDEDFDGDLDDEDDDDDDEDEDEDEESGYDDEEVTDLDGEDDDQ